jgi:predicted GNAT family acetyltransferase
MRAIRFKNAEDFERRATSMLLRHEAENNAFLGLIERFKAQPDTVLCAVQDDGDVIAVATMTPPWHMLISRCSPDAAQCLADFLTEQKIDLPGIQGDIDSVASFSARWEQHHPVRAYDRLGLGVYSLDRVIAPRPASGSLRKAMESDYDLLLRWGIDFTREIGEIDRGDGHKVTRDAIAAGRRFLWCDPAPVSACGVAGPTPNGIRINFVYTPPQHRGRGYASNAVAAVSQRMLDDGRKFCFLFTDLANPTSNKIYRDIGYKHVCDQRQLFFAKID